MPFKQQDAGAESVAWHWSACRCSWAWSTCETCRTPAANPTYCTVTNHAIQLFKKPPGLLLVAVNSPLGLHQLLLHCKYLLDVFILPPTLGQVWVRQHLAFLEFSSWGKCARISKIQLWTAQLETQVMCKAVHACFTEQQGLYMCDKAINMQSTMY